MSDQPKPTSEKLDSALRSLRDYHDEPRPYEGNPKPTGEWECPDCHTRKTMAEREKPDGMKSGGVQQMDEQLAAERRAAEVKWNEAVAVRDINHLNRIQELEKQLDAEHTNAEAWRLLAKGKEGAYVKMMQVSEVAANEWKVQTLVDAIQAHKELACCDSYDMLNAALEKVKS